jgi:hypothetical protein
MDAMDTPRAFSLLALGVTACAPSLCNVVETEDEHRVVAQLTFANDDGDGVSVAFDVNRTIDNDETPSMAFEGHGETFASFEYTGDRTSKALSVHFRSSLPELARLSDAELVVPELPGVGTFPLTNTLLCRCNDPSPFPGVQGCVEVGPDYPEYSGPSPRCEPVTGSLEVKQLAFSCDETFTVPTCSGDLDVWIRITPSAESHLSGSLHVVEHSERERQYHYCGGAL